MSVMPRSAAWSRASTPGRVAEDRARSAVCTARNTRLADSIGRRLERNQRYSGPSWSSAAAPATDNSSAFSRTNRASARPEDRNDGPKLSTHRPRSFLHSAHRVIIAEYPYQLQVKEKHHRFTGALHANGRHRHERGDRRHVGGGRVIFQPTSGQPASQPITCCVTGTASGMVGRGASQRGYATTTYTCSPCEPTSSAASC